MKLKEERYDLGEDLTIDLIPTKKLAKPMMNAPGIVFMSGEDSKGYHTVTDWIEFKNKDNLKLAQMGLELIQQALWREEEE